MQAGSLWCREVVVQQESDADLESIYFVSSSVLPGVNSHRYVAWDRTRSRRWHRSVSETKMIKRASTVIFLVVVVEEPGEVSRHENVEQGKYE